MKNFLIGVTVVVGCLSPFFAIYYFSAVKPCAVYGEMMGMETKFTGKDCYVKREGVWIEKFYNDQFQQRKLRGY